MKDISSGISGYLTIDVCLIELLWQVAAAPSIQCGDSDASQQLPFIPPCKHLHYCCIYFMKKKKILSTLWKDLFFYHHFVNRFLLVTSQVFDSRRTNRIKGKVVLAASASSSRFIAKVIHVSRFSQVMFYRAFRSCWMQHSLHGFYIKSDDENHLGKHTSFLTFLT